MSVRTLLVWNADERTRILGYDVTASAGPVVTSVKSNQFVDPQAYGNEASARAITYTVAPALDTLEGEAPLTDGALQTQEDLYIRRYTVDDSFCKLTGTLQNAGGVPHRAKIKFATHPLDAAQILPTGTLLLPDFSILANARGEFEAYLIRGSLVEIRVPDARLFARFVVPDQETATLADLDLTPYDRHRSE